MGLFLRQDEQRSDVQLRVAAELQERLRKTSLPDPADIEPSLLDDNHTTRPAGMVFIVLFVLFFIAIIAFAISIS